MAADLEYTLSVSLSVKAGLGCDVKFVKIEAGYQGVVEFSEKRAIHPIIPPGQVLYLYQSWTPEYADVYLSRSIFWRATPYKMTWTRLSFSSVYLKPTKITGGFMTSYAYA